MITAQELLMQHDQLAVQLVRLQKKADPAQNDRAGKSFLMGTVAGLGACFGGTALAMAAGMAQGSIQHYAVFFGGLVIGGAAAAAATWMACDGPEDAAKKGQATTQELNTVIDQLVDHPSNTEIDLVGRLAQRRMHLRQEEHLRAKNRDELTSAAVGGFAVGAALGAISSRPSGP